MTADDYWFLLKIMAVLAGSFATGYGIGRMLGGD